MNNFVRKEYIIIINKKAFQYDAVRQLASTIRVFISHKMSVLVGSPQVNSFEQVSSVGHQMSVALGPGGSSLMLGDVDVL